MMQPAATESNAPVHEGLEDSHEQESIGSALSNLGRRNSIMGRRLSDISFNQLGSLIASAGYNDAGNNNVSSSSIGNGLLGDHGLAAMAMEFNNSGTTPLGQLFQQEQQRRRSSFGFGLGPSVTRRRSSFGMGMQPRRRSSLASQGPMQRRRSSMELGHQLNQNQQQQQQQQAQQQASRRKSPDVASTTNAPSARRRTSLDLLGDAAVALSSSSTTNATQSAPAPSDLFLANDQLQPQPRQQASKNPSLDSLYNDPLQASLFAQHAHASPTRRGSLASFPYMEGIGTRPNRRGSLLFDPDEFDQIFADSAPPFDAAAAVNAGLGLGLGNTTATAGLDNSVDLMQLHQIQQLQQLEQLQEHAQMHHVQQLEQQTGQGLNEQRLQQQLQNELDELIQRENHLTLQQETLKQTQMQNNAMTNVGGHFNGPGQLSAQDQHSQLLMECSQALLNAHQPIASRLNSMTFGQPAMLNPQGNLFPNQNNIATVTPPQNNLGGDARRNSSISTLSAPLPADSSTTTTATAAASKTLTETTNQLKQSTKVPPQARVPELVLTKDTKVIITNFQESMSKSQQTQKDIQTWDKQMGLKRSHSSTMTKTTQSRNELRKIFKHAFLASSKNSAAKRRRLSKETAEKGSFGEKEE